MKFQFYDWNSKRNFGLSFSPRFEIIVGIFKLKIWTGLKSKKIFDFWAWKNRNKDWYI